MPAPILTQLNVSEGPASQEHSLLAEAPDLWRSTLEMPPTVNIQKPLVGVKGLLTVPCPSFYCPSEIRQQHSTLICNIALGSHQAPSLLCHLIMIQNLLSWTKSQRSSSPTPHFAGEAVETEASVGRLGARVRKEIKPDTVARDDGLDGLSLLQVKLSAGQTW